MVERWRQILPDCHHLAANSPQIVHHLQNFGFGFAQAQHDARFGHNSGGCDVTDHLQAGAVFGSAAYLRCEPLNSFHVVRNYFGSSVNHFLNQFCFTLKIRNQHFNLSVRIQRFYFANGFSPKSGSKIRQIIAID